MAQVNHSAVIFGCGNQIIGDDGFSPVVTAELETRPGEVFFADVFSIPVKEIHDFSLHQFSSANLLQELQIHTGGISVDILVAQVELIPDETPPGISSAMSGPVLPTCEKIIQPLSASGRTQGEPQ